MCYACVCDLYLKGGWWWGVIKPLRQVQRHLTLAYRNLAAGTASSTAPARWHTAFAERASHVRRYVRRRHMTPVHERHAQVQLRVYIWVRCGAALVRSPLCVTRVTVSRTFAALVRDRSKGSWSEVHHGYTRMCGLERLYGARGRTRVFSPPAACQQQHHRTVHGPISDINIMTDIMAQHVE